MKCFVTGGAVLLEAILLIDWYRKRINVTVFDNLSVGKIEFLKKNISNRNFKFIQADLLNLDEVKKAMNGHDIVFHLAANPETRLGIENTELDLKQETIVTYNVLEAMEN